MVLSMAWPMWSWPVMLGGGMTMQKGFAPSGLWSAGLKRPSLSHFS